MKVSWQVGSNVSGAVKASKGGAVEFRAEKAGIIQGSVGKASFAQEKLVDTFDHLRGQVALERKRLGAGQGCLLGAGANGETGHAKAEERAERFHALEGQIIWKRWKTVEPNIEDTVKAAANWE